MPDDGEDTLKKTPTKSTVEVLIKPVKAQKPAEILKELQKRVPDFDNNNSFAYFKREMSSRDLEVAGEGERKKFISHWDFALMEYAKITRGLEGIKISMRGGQNVDRELFDAICWKVQFSAQGEGLADPSASMYGRKRDKMDMGAKMQSTLFDAGVAVAVSRAEREGKAYLGDILEFYDAYIRCANIREPEVMSKAVSEYATAHMNGYEVSSTFFEVLDNFAGEGKGIPKEGMGAAIERLAKFATRMEGVEKGSSWQAMRALMLVKSGWEGSDPAKELDTRATFIEEFVLGARQMGELQFSKFFESVNQRGLELDDKTLERMLKLEKYFGIVQFARLQENEWDFKTIDELIRNFEDPEHNADRPIAVVTVGREGAGSQMSSIFMPDVFAAGNFAGLVNDLMKGYKVLVFTVGSPEGMADAAETVDALCANKGISVFIAAGHASKGSMNLNRSVWEQDLKNILPVPVPKLSPDSIREVKQFANPGDSQEHQRDSTGRGGIIMGSVKYFDPKTMFPKTIGDMSLDINEKADLKTMEKIMGHMVPGGQVFNYGCASGEGADAAKNLTNAWARADKGKLGIRCSGPLEPIEGASLKLNDRNMVVGIGYFGKNEFGKVQDIGVYTAGIDSAGKKNREKATQK